MKIPRGAIASLTASLRSSADTRLSSRAAERHVTREGLVSSDDCARASEHFMSCGAQLLCQGCCYLFRPRLQEFIPSRPWCLGWFMAHGFRHHHSSSLLSGFVSRMCEQTKSNHSLWVTYHHSTECFQLPRVFDRVANYNSQRHGTPARMKRQPWAIIEVHSIQRLTSPVKIGICQSRAHRLKLWPPHTRKFLRVAPGFLHD